MEEHIINHIRTVLLVTLSIVALIILYLKLLEYFKKDMDKKKYAVLLPLEYSDGKVLISIEMPVKTEVVLEVCNENEECLRSLLNETKNSGIVNLELNVDQLPERAAFLRFESDGQKVLRKLRS